MITLEWIRLGRLGEGTLDKDEFAVTLRVLFLQVFLLFGLWVLKINYRISIERVVGSLDIVIYEIG